MPSTGQRSPDGRSQWNGSAWVPATSGRFRGQSSAEAGAGPGFRWNGTSWVTEAEWNNQPGPGQPNSIFTPPVSANPAIPGNNANGTGGQTVGQVAGAVIPGGLFADGQGGSIGAQVLAAVSGLGRAPTDDEAIAIWRRAGLDPGQAATVHQYVKNWQVAHGGTAINEGQVNDLLGQVKAGQAPDASKWRGGTGAGGAGGTTPPAAGATVLPQTPYNEPGNHFLGSDSASHLNDLIKNNDGDFGILAQRLLSNQEGAQGGRFAAPIRSTFERKANDLEGLLTLESARDPSRTDLGKGTADVFQAGLGTGSQYDAPGTGYGRKLLNDTLDYAKANKAGLGTANPTTSTLLSKAGVTNQLKALKAALGIDTAATLSGSVGAQVDEAYKDYLGLHASDPNAASDFGSFLEYGKKRGIF